MKKKFVILILIALVLSAIFFFAWQLPLFIDNIKIFQDLLNANRNTAYFIRVFGSCISSLIVTIILAFLLYFTIKADLSELLSSAKEKRLAKQEAKRQEQLAELEAKKEEIEKTINDLKKE